MPRTLILSTIAVAAIASMAPTPALAAAPAGKKRCNDLLAFFDRWGATRTEHTDGAHNHTRIGAALECERGHYDEGIEMMEAPLLRKNFDVPREVGAAPLYEPEGGAIALAAEPLPQALLAAPR